jgi:hypothetical protein
VQEEAAKMKAFVMRLWDNPAIKDFPLSKKEAHLLGFLKENENQLKKVFASADYFPALSWQQASGLFLGQLIEQVLISISTSLDGIGNHDLLPKVLTSFYPEAHIDRDKFKQLILGLMKSNKMLRDHFIFSIEAVAKQSFNRYIPAVLDVRKTIYTEINRMDRIKLSPELMPAYFNLSVLFRPLYFLPIQHNSVAVSMNNLQDIESALPAFKTSMKYFLRDKIGDVPHEVFLFGMESYLNAVEVDRVSAAGRLINVLVNKQAQGQVKADRGAESPDKSWFSVTRKNAKYFGFDSRYLDELYLIASENNW